MEIRHHSDLTPQDLAAFDLVVVNVGDNYLFHGGIFKILEQAPCLGVFHDFYLHNLFNGWLAARGLGGAAAEAEMIATYGEGRRESAREAAAGQLDLGAMASAFPMTEWVASRCAGAFAHAEFYLPRLAAACPGPVAVGRMPFAGRDVGDLPRRRRKTVRTVTVGVMNANKCADKVIEAIARSPDLVSQIEYRLVGPIDPAEQSRLEALAHGLGYRGLRILGAVDDPQLASELEAADVVCCLRNPVLEGSSASAIEGLLSARPVIVADAGFYAELPEDMVFKVPADLPPAALTAVLLELASDEPLRRSTGARAKAWATEAFALEPYCTAIREAIDMTLRGAPWLAVGRALGADLASLHLGPEDPAIERIGRVLDPLLEAQQQPAGNLAAKTGRRGGRTRSSPAAKSPA